MKPLKPRDKVTQRMTRDGLTLDNQTTGESVNVSSREAEQEYTAEPGGAAEKVLERAGDIRDRHKAKQAAKDAGDVVTEAGEALHRPSSRLQFTAEERADPQLSKYIHKAEKKADKLDAAKDALPKKRVVTTETVYDEASGRAKTKLRFDKVEKPAPKLKPNPMSRPVQEAGLFVHGKIHEVEGENVGVEGGHKGEELAERQAGKAIRSGIRRHKLKPYRAAAKAERKSIAANAEYIYQKSLRDNPELAQAVSNPVSRFWQKQKIKRQYAKAAREARRAGQTAKKTAVTTEKIAGRVALFVKRHPIIFGIVALLLLLFFLISSVFTSCSSMGTGGLGIIAASSYVAEDQDINQAELTYTEWETDLQIQIQNAEAQHPGYDEYRYQVGNVGHNPFELMGFLTASYHGFTYEQIEAVLREIFSEQYRLEFIPETEIRSRTETRVDPITGETTEEEVPYEWHILNIKLTANSFTDVIAGRMDNGQKELFNILMMSKGNRQYVANIFGDTDWLPYVTSYYGYRVHPISGGKDYHKAVDIGMPLGTEILAGHDGTVTQAGESGSYGLVVVIEGTMKDGRTLTTKYAHCSQLLVTPGQSVKQGDVIAKVGSTGNSTGSHLHLEVLVDGQYFNPLYFTDTGNHTAGTMAPGTPGGPEIPAYPGEPMGDGSYAALIAEAQKHLGKPYVFGASGPNSFDCSGFVCYVFNQSGVANVGRTTAQGLYNMSTPVSRENARPGDLIFFTGTYSAGTPVTHIGIYIGNGQMIHAGDPVQYASIDTSYWQQHFYAFGRLN